MAVFLSCVHQNEWSVEKYRTRGVIGGIPRQRAWSMEQGAKGKGQRAKSMEHRAEGIEEGLPSALCKLIGATQVTSGQHPVTNPCKSKISGREVRFRNTFHLHLIAGRPFAVYQVLCKQDFALTSRT